jgi:hypothetical protein
MTDNLCKKVFKCLRLNRKLKAEKQMSYLKMQVHYDLKLKTKSIQGLKDWAGKN